MLIVVLRCEEPPNSVLIWSLPVVLEPIYLLAAFSLTGTYGGGGWGGGPHELPAHIECIFVPYITRNSRTLVISPEYCHTEKRKIL